MQQVGHGEGVACVTSGRLRCRMPVPRFDGLLWCALLFLAHGLMISSWFAQVPAVKTRLELNDSELGNVML